MEKRFIDTPEFQKVIRKIIFAMKMYDWCLIGGRASEIWRNPPQTPDVDILAKITDDDVRHITSAFAQKMVVRESVWTDLSAPFIFLKDRTTGVEIDIFGSMEPLHDTAIRKAAPFAAGREEFNVARPEYIVLLKAQAATDIGREVAKRLRDRQAILDLAKNQKLDRKLIRLELVNNRMTSEARLLEKIGVI